MSIKGAHRSIAYIQFHYACVKFTSQGLYSCTVAHTDPHVVSLVHALTKHSLDEWAVQQKADQPPYLDGEHIEKTPFQCDQGSIVSSRQR